jgi:hypothetical protein
MSFSDFAFPAIRNWVHLYGLCGDVIIDDIIGNISCIFTLFSAKLELFNPAT